MRVASGACLGLLLLLVAARAEERAGGKGAGAVTERGRSLARILDLALAPVARGEGALLLLLDPTPSLRDASFAAELEAALGRHPRARVGVAVLGGEGKALLPGTNHGAVSAKVREAVPDKRIRNVYAAVRRAAGLLAGRDGPREMLLLTLENGDAEDDLEGVVATLRRAGVRLSVVAREAFLSDTYWISGAAYSIRPPKGSTMTGADGAFVEMPWGWLFQMTRATESAPSGFAMYGLNRLAGATGGRVLLHYPRRGRHRCSLNHACPFCGDEHSASLEVFRTQRLAAIAPSTAPRRDVLKAAARDPYHRALLRAWKEASKAGLVRSRPAVKPAGGTLVAERRMLGTAPSWSGTSWRRFANRAEKLAAKAEAIATALRSDLERAHKAGGSARYRACAEFTHVMLRVTRVNLLLCAAYSREVAPAAFGGARADQPTPPEVSLLATDWRMTGLGYSNLSLCHGVKPFFSVKLPGGEKIDAELVALDRDLARFLRRNAYTPFASALARMGLARFHPVGIGRRVPPPPRDPRGSETGTSSTRTERQGGASGNESGPTSGG